LKKSFAKPLDKRAGMWYNSQAVQNTADYGSALADGSLTIEQQEIKVQAKASAKESRISLKEISILSRDGDILKQVKKSQTSSTKDFNCLGSLGSLNTICSRV